MEEKQENKKRSKKSLIIDITLLVVSACLFLATCVIFYQKVYLKTFYVNGQSMWPTLNEFATDSNGKTVGENGGKSYAGYTVDCGVYDSHKSSLKKIKRFDIVSTHYPGRENEEFIKRVIGLPGDHIEFKTDVEHNGDLYINGNYVEQPIKTEILRKGSYTTNNNITLKDNEYYVCGDNRGNSQDSRSIGPVTKEMLVGRVIAIIGTGKITTDKDGNDYVKPSKIKYHRVRFMI